MPKSPVENLRVWKQSIELTVHIYKITERFPASERYGLVSQMRRCAVSVASNLAEGSERSTDKEFRHFVYIAKGSSAELYTQLVIAQSLALIPNEEFTITSEKVMKIKKQLGALSRTLASG